MYPSTSFLVRGSDEPRLRVLDAAGRPDHEAITKARQLLRHAPGLESKQGQLERKLVRLAATAPGAVREFQGLTVVIDRPAGTVQTGTGPDGTEWSRTYLVDYGFLPQTVGGDGEEMDVYLGPNEAAPNAYLIVQMTMEGEFDEFKLMLGCEDSLEALDLYLLHAPTWCYGGMIEVPVPFIAGLLNVEPAVMMQALKAARPVKGPRFVKRKSQRTDKAAHFRKLPVVVKAELIVAPIEVKTVEGVMAGNPGSWLVTGVQGEQHVCDRQVFRETYEPANAEGFAIWELAYGQAPVPVVPPAALSLAQKEAGGEAGGDVAAPPAPPVGAPSNVEPGVVVDEGEGKEAADAPGSSAAAPADTPPPEPLDTKGRIQKSIGGAPGTEWTGWITTPAGGWIAYVAPGGEQIAWELTDSAWGPAIGWTPRGDALSTVDLAAVWEHGRGLLRQVMTLELGGAPVGKVEPPPDPAAVPGAPVVMESSDPIAEAKFEGTARVKYIHDDLDPVAKADGDKGKRLVYAVVLEPNPMDGKGDTQGHTYTAEDVERACHFFASFLMLNDQHGVYIEPHRARVVENYIAPQDLMLDNELVKKGSWVMVVHIADDALWAKVEDGTWRAFSIEGYSRHIPITPEEAERLAEEYNRSRGIAA